MQTRGQAGDQETGEQSEMLAGLSRQKDKHVGKKRKKEGQEAGQQVVGKKGEQIKSQGEMVWGCTQVTGRQGDRQQAHRAVLGSTQVRRAS